MIMHTLKRLTSLFPSFLFLVIIDVNTHHISLLNHNITEDDMSGFKKPKAYVPGKAAVGISMASKKAMADDMGFSSMSLFKNLFSPLSRSFSFSLWRSYNGWCGLRSVERHIWVAHFG